MSVHAAKRDATLVKEDAGSLFLEYDLPFKAISMGVSEIDGRYPAAGFEVDKKVNGAWYVLSGSGTVFVKGEAYQLTTGDVILIPKNQKYWIQGNHLRLVVASSPAWTKAQHAHVDE